MFDFILMVDFILIFDFIIMVNFIIIFDFIISFQHVNLILQLEPQIF